MSEPIKMSYKQQLAHNEWKRKQFDRFKETLKLAVANGEKIEMGKAMIPLVLEQMEAEELRYCELVAMFGNNLVAMGSALICIENKDTDGAQEWLENTTDNCEAHQWQLFDNAQEYYDHMHMPYPRSTENHRENVVALDVKLDALEPKWEEFRKKSFEGTGIKP